FSRCAGSHRALPSFPTRRSSDLAMKLTLFLSGLVAVLFAGSLLTGPAGFGPSEALAALLRGEGEATMLVMREIRLPRAVLGLLRSEEHTSELQSRENLVCRLLLE